MDKAMRDELGRIDNNAGRILDHTPRGVSMVLDPTGEIVAGPLTEEEGILYADIDVAQCVEPKQFHDVVGYYNRFDIFKLTVDRSANRPIHFEFENGQHVKNESVIEDVTATMDDMIESLA